MKLFYNKEFYKDQQDGSYSSALNIIPLLFEIYKPNSVLDLGCGVGTWLRVFRDQYQVSTILGVDGSYVDTGMLKIDGTEFSSQDLTKYYKAPHKFDLAISMEVAEHLPESSADDFVRSLTDASDIVLFSAALPGQIGTYHINEQYPEYWAKKFMSRGFIPVDCIRKRVWHNEKVEWWYKQNAILYIKSERYETSFKEQLAKHRAMTDPEFLTRIHPDMLQYFVGKFFQLQSFSGFIGNKLYPLKKFLRRK